MNETLAQRCREAMDDHSAAGLLCFNHSYHFTDTVFEKYHVDQIEQSLSDTAEKISGIIESHRNDGLGEEIVFEIVDDPMAVAIAYDKERFHYSPDTNESNKIPRTYF